MRKRLVVCCDGTWNRPDSAHVTNVEKIARTISTDLASTHDVQQLVLYLQGVGSSGYLADKLLGGAFGFGLFEAIKGGYRWLALNYEPGDEIFVFGFSRGAYTARSLVGMIGRVGLLTRQSLVSGHLPEAVERYRRKRPDNASYHGTSDKRFREVHSHPHTTIAFLGVFDTVGALGVPGALGRRHQFHDVQLSKAVLCARQALAIDEHRMKFEPSLWEPEGPLDDTASAQPPEDPRVKQVWFEGAHSDVGGGYAETGLSDTTLGWMSSEAATQGLVFDHSLLDQYLLCGSEATRHESVTFMYHVLNLFSRIRLMIRPPAGGRRFAGHERVLGRRRALSVRISSAVADHYRDDDHDRHHTRGSSGYEHSQDREWYHPRNVATYAGETDGFAGREEPVVARPA
jgi:uncharacterized protein (DUF2235 family)